MKRLGYLIIGASIIWLMGVVGADDAAVMGLTYVPFIPLAGKVLLGFGGIGLGRRLATR